LFLRQLEIRQEDTGTLNCINYFINGGLRGIRKMIFQVIHEFPSHYAEDGKANQTGFV
jgi:hypothetical protein